MKTSIVLGGLIIFIYLWLHYIDPIFHEYGHARELVLLGDTPIVTIKTRFINKVKNYKGITFIFSTHNVSNMTYSKYNFCKYNEHDIHNIARAGVKNTLWNAAVCTFILTALSILSMFFADDIMHIILSIGIVTIDYIVIFSIIVSFFTPSTDVYIIYHPSAFIKCMNDKRNSGVDDYNDILTKFSCIRLNQS